ncbi:hypothetical protein AC529_10435 [Thermobifida cellulosilytica TB100]|uniref:Lipoprotein n=1 Tax=Thermobifida cellulosilytica TB100 TaxID=665004 RepID=A0A147KHG9_THECS|nr:hypothetical protein AC529_10435 [Thermobifida cellulosilytica TB100]
MTLSRLRTVFRTLLSTVLAVAAGAALAACSTQGEEVPAETVAEQSQAPVLGDYDNRIQLVEGTPYTLTTEEGDSFVLEITGYDDAKPSVVISVTPDGGRGEEQSLELGEELEVGGVSWHVSELGFSESMPGSVTLTRAE